MTKPRARRSYKRARPEQPTRPITDHLCRACRILLHVDATGNFCNVRCQRDFLRAKYEAQMEAELLSPA